MDFWEKFVIGLVVCAFGLLLWSVWGLICSGRTYSKRKALIERTKSIPGDRLLAYAELDRVGYNQHQKYLMRFRNPRKLYGPLLQGIWDGPHHALFLGYSEYWWQCYNEIYLSLTPSGLQPSVHLLMSRGLTLPGAIESSGIDIEDWLGVPPELPKFSMADGVEEYEQAMAAQEIMGGQ